MERIYDDLCRLCLKSDNILQPIFYNKDVISVADKIAICMRVNVNENDGFPRNICMPCLNNLEKSYQFQKTCEYSDKMLHAMHGAFTKMTQIKNAPKSTQIEDDKLTLPHVLQSILEDNDACMSNDLFRKLKSYMDDLQLSCESETPNACNGNKTNIDKAVLITEIDKNTPPVSVTENKIVVTNNHLTIVNKSGSMNKIKAKVRHRYKAEITNKSKKQPIKKIRKIFTMQDILYNCKSCNHIFNSQEKLLQHRINMHSRRYTCLYCNKTFRSLSIRKEHMQLHKPESEIMTCNICNKSCKSQKALRAHKLIHSEALKANCEICHRVFSSSANMRRHMMIHLNQRPHMCHFCGMSFNQAGTRDTHIMVKHSPEKIHRCKMCTMRFETIDLLQNHMSRHELQSKLGASSNVMTPTCKQCNKTFATQANLKNHMNWHDKPFLCIVCGKGFASKHTLKNHERTHTGERPFACTICEKTFTMNVLLKSHLRSHDDDNGKKFECTYCLKKFALLSTLKTHTYIHTGERPFKCNVCQKTFNQKAHLRTHLFTHTGEKKHVCDICNKAFALKEGLRYHVMTHTGETPFVCSHCGRGFYIQYKLKIHMLKAHNIELKTEIKS